MKPCGFVRLKPTCTPGIIMSLWGVRLKLIRLSAFITVVGIVLNRLNVSIIAFNWQLPAEQRYFPHWMEIWITISIITVLMVAFKWIANRMPIMYEHPEYKGMH